MADTVKLQPRQALDLKLWRVFFFVCGAFSVVGGIGGFFMFRQVLQDAGRPEPIYGHTFMLLFLTVAIFGVGYLMVWRDPWGNRNIVVLGLLTKICGFFVSLYALRIGEMPPENAWQPWIADLPWGLAFVIFLWQTRNGPPTTRTSTSASRPDRSTASAP